MRTNLSSRTAGAQTELPCTQSVLILAFLAVSCYFPSLKAATTQGAEAQKKHIVGARFESGPREGELMLLFTISPRIGVEPVVRWLSATTKAKTLKVGCDSGSRCSAVLADTMREADGQVLIELSDSKSGLHELHSVDFAQREVLASRASSSPSRDGRFVVFTRPVGISQAQRLLIGSSEQPMSPLPPGVSADAVDGVYSLDFLPPMGIVDGWQLTMTAPSDTKPALFYLAKAGTEWKALDAEPVQGHPLIMATVAGPGIYLVVRQVQR